MESAKVVEIEEEEDEVEDWCFICKDGGNLMLCDYKDCRKVYHAYCVEKEITVKGNEESFICKCHICYLCPKRPKLYCLCCPHAVCEGCVTRADFIHLKENKGLCNECHEYVDALEEIREYNPTEDKIDLTDTNTYEGLFLEYWEIVKEQEGISFNNVRASKSRKKGVKSKPNDDPKFSVDNIHTSKSRKKGVKLKCKDDPNFSLTDHAVEDAEDYKTLGKSKGMEFIGWGSKLLIDFLTSIGEDTKDAMSQHSLESVIRRYIRQKNLLDPAKKKKVCCDEKLYSIFRKKSVNHNKIYNLLERHLKENVEQMEFLTRLECGFGEKNEKVILPCKKQKTEMSDEKICEKEMEPEMRSTGLATINSDNIKLVYLRKSLVVELLKQNEGNADKVLGSFVKVKNDPRELMAYQILQVTGIKTADEPEGVLFKVAGMASEVSISKLDDSDISKDEIEDLKQKVLNGLLKQPTVLEIKQKAKTLHEDITKHWIARQITILQKRINYANEKGLRRELEEYLKQRELLQKPSEQERLLKQTPRIIEDLVEIRSDAGLKIMNVFLKDIVPAAQNNINTRFIILDKARSPETVANGKNCIALAADETAAVHIQLWGEECDAFEAGDIVRLTNGIFSYVRNSGLVLRAGKRGKMEKMGEFTIAFVETPNVSEIQWNPDPENPKRYIQNGAVSAYSRVFPPLP